MDYRTFMVLIHLTCMNSILIKIAAYAEVASELQSIRKEVFQIEQGVASTIDFDGRDQTAYHVVSYADQTPVGTARIRFLSDQLAKIERVAVLPSHRRHGIGHSMMSAAIAFLDQAKIPETKVHAQVHVAHFYQKLGFQPRGDSFYEANILHIEMARIHPKAEET